MISNSLTFPLNPSINTAPLSRSVILISLHPDNNTGKARFNRVSPEVGDLQRSSEALEPSLESQSAEGAAEVGIKHSGLRPTAGKKKDSGSLD